MRNELVKAAQDGDHEAFEVLATSEADRLYATARLILRDAAEAEDAVQEALVHAWQDLPGLRDPHRFGAWLYRLLVNACADQGRRRRRWSAEVRMIGPEPAIEDRMDSIANRDALERGFRRLRPEQRAAVVLRFYVGLPVREIANLLDIPLGTAKSRLHYASEALRAALEADARGGETTNGWSA